MPSQPRQPNDSPESGSGATPAYRLNQRERDRLAVIARRIEMLQHRLPQHQGDDSRMRAELSALQWAHAIISGDLEQPLGHAVCRDRIIKRLPVKRLPV